MKKLLFILFILPVFCFAQTNFTPQFKRNIPVDNLLGYSIPGVTGNYWLPDTAWVKKYAGGTTGSFLPLSGGIMTGKQFFNTTASDSLGVWWGNGAHGVGSDRAGIYLSQPTTDHSLFTFHLDDNAHFDFFRWEVNTNSAGGAAVNKTAGLLNLDRFDIKSDSSLFRNYFRFTSGITQTNTTVLDSTQFDSQITDGTTLSDIGQLANGASIGSIDLATSNSNSINSFASVGGETGFSLQTVNGGSGNNKEIYVSTGTGAPEGIKFYDSVDGIGPNADASIDTANMTTHPKMYVTSEWVLGHSGSAVNLANSNLVSTGGRTFDMNDHTLSFTYSDGSGLAFTTTSADLFFNADGSVVNVGAANSTTTTQAFSSYSGGDISGTEPFLNHIVRTGGQEMNFGMQKSSGFNMSNSVDGLGANYGSGIDTAASHAAFGGKQIMERDEVEALVAASGGGGGSSVWGAITGTLSDQTDLQSALDAKQATLVSGTNIKTINSSSILGSGNINLQTPLTAGTDYEVPLTFTSGVSRSSNTVKADTSVLRTVANSYSLSGMATKLANYLLKTDTTSAFVNLVHINGAETILGRKSFSSGLQTNTTAATSNLFVNGNGDVASGTLTAGLQFGGSTQVDARAYMSGTTSTSITNGHNYMGFGYGLQPISVANTVTVPWAVNLLVKPVGTITKTGTGSVTNTASLYIDGANTGGGTNYALYINNGNVNLGNNTTTVGNLQGTTVYATTNFSTTVGALLDGTAVLSMQPSTNNSSSGSARQLLLGASTNLIHASFGSPATGPTLGVGNTASAIMMGTPNYKIAASGINPIVTNLAVLPPTISATAGTGVLTEAASLYVAGAPVGTAASNYSIHAVGLSRFGRLTIDSGIVIKTNPVAINATATATAAQMANGYITSTSASATTITTATATALATQLGNVGQGASFEFTIDNTAGANTVTLALGSGFTQLNTITGANTLTVPSGTAGIGTWRITFVSTTAATISRIQ